MISAKLHLVGSYVVEGLLGDEDATSANSGTMFLLANGNVGEITGEIRKAREEPPQDQPKGD